MRRIKAKKVDNINGAWSEKKGEWEQVKQRPPASVDEVTPPWLRLKKKGGHPDSSLVSFSYFYEEGLSTVSEN